MAKNVNETVITKQILGNISRYKTSCDKLFGGKSSDKIMLKRCIKNIPLLLQDYTILIKSITGHNLQKINYDRIIEGVLYATPKELEKKQSDINFYIQNATAFVEVMTIILDQLNKIDFKKANVLVLDFFIKTIDDLMIDSYFLLNDIIVKYLKEKYSLGGRRRIQPTFNMWQSFRQSLYPKGSGFCFWDKEYDGAAVAMIRVAIENKTRNAFGCFGILDTKNNHNFIPLDLTRIFEYVKPHVKDGDIITLVPLHNIIRINSWTNLYLHGGHTDYSWLTHLLYFYLHPLFVGAKGSIKTGGSIDSGVKIKKGILMKMWDNIEKDINKPRRFSIFNIFRKNKKRYILYRYETEKDAEAILV